MQTRCGSQQWGERRDDFHPVTAYTGRVCILHFEFCIELARPPGLEPAAYGFEVRRSIQLSYGRTDGHHTTRGACVLRVHRPTMTTAPDQIPRRDTVMIVPLAAAGLVLTLAAPALAQGTGTSAQQPQTTGDQQQT